MKTVALCVALSCSFGCATVATTYTPIIDTRGVEAARYATDLYECREFAQQIDQANNAAAGALAGAIFGTVIGALLGLRGRDLAQVAGTGAVVGGVNSAAYAGMSQAQIIQRCMIGRGYNVLG